MKSTPDLGQTHPRNVHSCHCCSQKLLSHHFLHYEHWQGSWSHFTAREPFQSLLRWRSVLTDTRPFRHFR